jgi:predicted transcriptional regulator
LLKNVTAYLKNDRSPTESRKRHEQKQAKARELREKLMQDKAERLKEISKKVHIVCHYKN